MKENSIKNERSSIEEYVKILEKFSNENVIYGSTVGMTLEKYKDLQLSAEHILSDYKRVLKENEELKEDRDKFKKALGRRITYCNELEKDLFENSSNYVIKKQKVKDKIEELKKKVEELTDEKGYWGGSDLLEQIKVLQELLEKEQ